MSGKRVPYFNFYPTDFMRGVRGMTPQEVGIYAMLLCLIYEQNGPVAMNPPRLSAYCGCRVTTLEKAISRLAELGRITVTDGMVMDDRAADEIAKREHALKLQSRAGEISAEKRKQNQGKTATDVQPTFNHTDTDKEEEKKEAKASQKNPQPAPIAPVLEQWASPAAVASFIAYRRKIKHPLTLTAAKRLAENLKAIFNRDGDPDEAFAMAEDRGWRTVEADWYFNAKGQGNGQQQRPKSTRAEFDRAFIGAVNSIPDGATTLEPSKRDPFAIRARGNAAAG